MLHGPKSTQRLAAKLRRDMTWPEVMLWRALKQRPAGLRFRHQHPAGPYVLDFYCPRATLCVEVDGELHAMDDRPRRDTERDAFLASHGVRVLRVPARDVLVDLDAVVRRITATARR